jgi:hypothetical protein
VDRRTYCCDDIVKKTFLEVIIEEYMSIHNLTDEDMIDILDQGLSEKENEESHESNTKVLPR